MLYNDLYHLSNYYKLKKWLLVMASLLSSLKICQLMWKTLVFISYTKKKRQGIPTCRLQLLILSWWWLYTFHIIMVMFGSVPFANCHSNHVHAALAYCTVNVGSRLCSLYCCFDWFKLSKPIILSRTSFVINIITITCILQFVAKGFDSQMICT